MIRAQRLLHWQVWLVLTPLIALGLVAAMSSRVLPPVQIPLDLPAEPGR